MSIETSDHLSRIPPSLTITRYLHEHAAARTIKLIGPLHKGETPHDEPLIFVDGGAQLRQNNEGLAVGDGDSYSGTLDERLNTQKDYSDLAYVLASLPAHFHQVMLHGFLGERRDHELANLGEANAFLKHRHHPTRLQFDTAICGFSAGDWQLEIHEPFSLLSIEPAKVTLKGACAYQLKQLTQIDPLCSHGLSNIGNGAITLKTDVPVFIVYSQRRD